MDPFTAKKRRILAELASPMPDLSPKGGPDAQILPLLDLVNAHPLMVTTSSCAGRVSVYAEGVRCMKSISDEREEQASEAVARTVGGKGGGRWLYVTHEELPSSVQSWSGLLLGEGISVVKDTDSSISGTVVRRYIHFKFEPMILHVLCATPEIAHKLLTIALDCGFRESGYNGNILAVRCSLSLDAPIGYLSADIEDSAVLIVDESYLDILIQMARERYTENRARTQKFEEGMRSMMLAAKENETKETKEQRRVRKHAEGLQRQQEKRAMEQEKSLVETQAAL
ncbi:tRNA wybutosine-synthesizing protein [Limtongia smithiae]|uniref:tRNA wybutosine-synthesizing protein n=1 Tax=Limtongia smithiae TaxID=1125753 RepID=UPI0034CEE073